MPAPKKALVKKAPAKKPLDKVKYYPSMSQFSGYAIHRNKKGIVSFGCGAVRVERQDLIDLANFLENEKNKETIGLLRYVDFRYSQVTTSIPADPKLLHQIADILTSETPGVVLIKKIVHNTNGYFRQSALLTNTPETYRRIAGKVPIPVVKTKRNVKGKA